MKYAYVGTKEKIKYILEMYDEQVTAKLELENVQTKYTDFENITLKRIKAYYDLGNLGKLFDKNDIVKLTSTIAKSYVDLITFTDTSTCSFTISLKVKSVSLEKEHQEQSLFDGLI